MDHQKIQALSFKIKGATFPFLRIHPDVSFVKQHDFLHVGKSYAGTIFVTVLFHPTKDSEYPLKVLLSDLYTSYLSRSNNL